MPKLSVNVNKVATVRNSRGGELPSVIEAVRTCIDAGATGITVHPRADARHITTADVHDIARELAPLKGRVEFNIEGDPRPDLIELVLAVKPDQCTLVPVFPGEITSQAGWPVDTPQDALAGVIGAIKAGGVRVSLFVSDFGSELFPDFASQCDLPLWAIVYHDHDQTINQNSRDATRSSRR